jgi:hypothetical protein
LCINKKCVECGSDSDCGSDKLCKENLCVNKKSEGEECKNDNECMSNKCENNVCFVPGKKDAESAIAGAKNAINKAQSDGRTDGIDNAKDKLTSAENSFKSGDYSAAGKLAGEAKALADNSQKPEEIVTLPVVEKKPLQILISPENLKEGDIAVITIKSGGEIVPGVKVTVTAAGKTVTTGTTDDKGQIKLAPGLLKAGEMSVTASKDEYETASEKTTVAYTGGRTSLWNYLFYLIIILLVILILTALILLVIKRGKKEKKKPAKGLSAIREMYEKEEEKESMLKPIIAGAGNIINRAASFIKSKLKGATEEVKEKTHEMTAPGGVVASPDFLQKVANNNKQDIFQRNFPRVYVTKETFSNFMGRRISNMIASETDKNTIKEIRLKEGALLKNYVIDPEVISVIALARERNALLLMDDWNARSVAGALGIRSLSYDEFTGKYK